MSHTFKLSLVAALFASAGALSSATAGPMLPQLHVPVPHIQVQAPRVHVVVPRIAVQLPKINTQPPKLNLQPTIAKVPANHGHVVCAVNCNFAGLPIHSGKPVLQPAHGPAKLPPMGIVTSKPPGQNYAGGTPYFDESTGKYVPGYTPGKGFIGVISVSR
jgi:hypothetical protein